MILLTEDMRSLKPQVPAFEVALFPYRLRFPTTQPAECGKAKGSRELLLMPAGSPRGGVIADGAAFPSVAYGLGFGWITKTLTIDSRKLQTLKQSTKENPPIAERVYNLSNLSCYPV